MARHSAGLWEAPVRAPYTIAADFVFPFCKEGGKSLLHPLHRFTLPGSGGQNLFGIIDREERVSFGLQSYRRRLGPTFDINLIIIIC